MAEIIKFPKHRRLTQKFPGHTQARESYKKWIDSGAKGGDFLKMKEGMSDDQIKWINNRMIDDAPNLRPGKNPPISKPKNVTQLPIKYTDTLRHESNKPNLDPKIREGLRTKIKSREKLDRIFQGLESLEDTKPKLDSVNTPISKPKWAKGLKVAGKALGGVAGVVATLADTTSLNVGEDKEVRERKARWRREMSTKPGLMMN